MKNRSLYKKFGIFSLLCVLALIGKSTPKKELIPAYQKPELSIELRLNDLMNRMTLEEKIGQMCQYLAPQHIQEIRDRMKKAIALDKGDIYCLYPGLEVKDLEQLVIDGKAGSFLYVKDAAEANHLQKLVMQSRLKIPLLFGIDAIHGDGLVNGATVFPTPLAMSSSWDDELLRRVAAATAEEVRATGMHWTFSPDVDIARDPRWGRCGETFGEDTYLISQLGVAFTKGYQGDFGKNNILACAKHFIAGSEPSNGTNVSPMDVSMYQLREVWLPPYQAQVAAGVASFMAAHNEVNGVPCHANKLLMTDILRDEWNFRGFVVSDWMDIEHLCDPQRIVPTVKEAAGLSVNAGIDMHMQGLGFFESMDSLVREGKVPLKRINEACRSILRYKFMLGLFEHPIVDEKKAERVLFNQPHQQLTLEAARKSIVLLKNDSNILPLKKVSRILVTGPNANNHRILGDWVYPQPEKNIVTVYQGIRQQFPASVVDCINSGESIRYPVERSMDEAVAKADRYDAVVVVVGSNSLRYDYNERTCGENDDRAQIDLMGNQLELIQKIYARNKQVIVVLVNGRPLAIPWVKRHIPAVIEAWEPGAKGGQAVAEVISGAVNPSGKLTMSFPYSSGQVHYTYNHKTSHLFHPFIDEPSEPLWAFGYGMSYTKFSLNGLQIDKQKAGLQDTLHIKVEVQNVGPVDGTEIVQLYIRDNYSSRTRPVKELKGYQRTELEVSERKIVEFNLPVSDLGFYNEAMKYVVEPGDFTIMVGDSSRDSDLLSKTVAVE